MNNQRDASVLLFEIHQQAGSVIRIYEDGGTEGLPPDAVITNHALRYRNLRDQRLETAKELIGRLGNKIASLSPLGGDREVDHLFDRAREFLKEFA